jgi:hypothetical protein
VMRSMRHSIQAVNRRLDSGGMGELADPTTQPPIRRRKTLAATPHLGESQVLSGLPDGKSSLGLASAPILSSETRPKSVIYQAQSRGICIRFSGKNSLALINLTQVVKYPRFFRLFLEFYQRTHFF